jgi:hypothetical protein
MILAKPKACFAKQIMSQAKLNACIGLCFCHRQKQNFAYSKNKVLPMAKTKFCSMHDSFRKANHAFGKAEVMSRGLILPTAKAKNRNAILCPTHD